jgi:GNAT superfamily N-acetyltransferase
MIIKLADLSDLSQIVDKGEVFHSLLPIDCTYYKENISNWLETMISEESKGGIIVAKEGNIVAGFMILISYPFYLDPNYILASELCWWVEPECRSNGIGSKLLQAAKTWAVYMGAKQLIMADIVTSTDLSSFYLANGFKLKEKQYYLEVN